MNRSIDDAGKMRYDQLLRLLYERYVDVLNGH